MSKTKIRRDIIKEKVKASDMNAMNLQYSCESCSFFKPNTSDCSLGYNTQPHLQKNQNKLYEQTGRLIFCRFLEID